MPITSHAFRSRLDALASEARAIGLHNHAEVLESMGRAPEGEMTLVFAEPHEDPPELVISEVIATLNDAIADLRPLATKGPR